MQQRTLGKTGFHVSTPHVSELSKDKFFTT